MSESAAPIDRATTTRERILAALADIVSDGGLADFSVQAVADRCGVSHRTVYRYFPTRESMLDGLIEQLSEAMEEAGGAATVEELDDLAPAVEVNFGMFTDNERVAEAAARFSVGTAIENRDRRVRTHAVATAVERVGLPREDVAIVAGVLRHLSSSRTWLLLRDTGLNRDETIAAARWATEVLVAAIHEGRLPSTVKLTGQTKRGTP